MLPMGVCTPASERDIKDLLDICIDKGISITPRGSGTSTVGQAIGSGIVIDHTKFMNRILKIEKDYVDVQPGIILSDLNRELEKHGVFFPVDPSSADVSTIGGMVGNNSSGIHSFLYGDTKDYVLGLEGFWADGKFFSTINGVNVDGVLQKLFPFKRKAQEAMQHLPQATKNSSGYNILEALTGQGISLNHLLTGSEGTLCIMTKIRLKVVPLPEARITVLSLFDEFEKALEAVTLAKGIKGISAIELLDRELIDVTRRDFPEFRTFFKENINAGLLFEIDGESEFTKDQYEKLEKVLSALSITTEVATSDEKRKQLWWFRRSATSIFNRIHSSTRPLRFIEDVAVPFEKIIDFYRAEKKILDGYGLQTAFFGHIGNGHFHINPRVDTREPGFQKKIDEISKRTYELVQSIGGTFSAEHGDGVLREPYIRELQPELYKLFYQIKEILDPNWILNPGKIVSKDTEKGSPRYGFTPIQKASANVVNAVERCHGCNSCIRFCMATKHNARGRASVMRNIVSGIISTPKEIKKAVRYIEKCRLCGKCLVECPAGVDLLETASLLREEGLIPMSLTKRIMMKLFSPLRDLLKHEVTVLEKNDEFRVNSVFNPVLRLGLYYKPYTREILKLVRDKNISLIITDNDLQKYLTSRT
jgi:FAD/FMN-containing dehydrogenase/ferredoxin